MKNKNNHLILVILIACAAVLNFQAVSAKTSDKASKSKAVVKQAELPGLLKKTLDYPSEAMSKNLQGTVKVLAVIEPDGSVSGTRILQDIGGNCAKEVSKAVSKLHFEPFIENGVASRHALVINVNFMIRK